METQSMTFKADSHTPLMISMYNAKNQAYSTSYLLHHLMATVQYGGRGLDGCPLDELFVLMDINLKF